jgi:hypothetical protein
MDEPKPGLPPFPNRGAAHSGLLAFRDSQLEIAP